jgi:predicted outer membrane repeat protein
VEALEERWVPAQISLTVNSLDDTTATGTLRAAILAADGDANKQSDQFTIGFSVSGTIVLQNPLPVLSASIAIQGPGASSLTIKPATGTSFTSEIIAVAPGQNASLSGLTIANGSFGGIFNDGGTLTVSGCALSGNGSVSSGVGGIFNVEGTLTVTDSTLSGNFDGGGIINDFGTVTVTDSTLSGNSGGGGIHNEGTLDVKGCTLSGNSAFDGGAIFSSGTLTVSGTTVCDNTARFGGGIFNFTAAFGFASTATISDCTLSGNSATVVIERGGLVDGGQGGAIANAGDEGGAATMTILDCTLSGNTAVIDGGGIANSNFRLGSATVTVRSCTLTGNTAGEGGAIFNDLTSTLVIHGSNFCGNTAGTSGGAIANLGTATLQDCTLSHNSAGAQGGGIFNDTTGTLTIDDSTVLSNVAPLGADLYNLGSATLNDSTVGVIGP